MLSETCKKMLANKKGYRSDSAFGDGVRDIRSVAIHETFELGNNGIADTLMNEYKELLNEDEWCICEHICEYDADCTEEEKKFFGDTVFRIASIVVGSEDIRCIWLAATKELVVDTYLATGLEKDSEEYLDMINNIDEYDIVEWELPEKICILDDVPFDGTLFAFVF